MSLPNYSQARLKLDIDRVEQPKSILFVWPVHRSQANILSDTHSVNFLNCHDCTQDLECHYNHETAILKHASRMS